MHGPINVKSPNNISKWQMGFNSAFKGLILPPSKELNRSVSAMVEEFMFSCDCLVHFLLLSTSVTQLCPLHLAIISIFLDAKILLHRRKQVIIPRRKIPVT
jgi:hypothetical protein